MSRSSLPLSRRDWLQLSLAGVSGSCLSGWLAKLAAGAATDPKRRRPPALPASRTDTSPTRQQGTTAASRAGTAARKNET